MCVISVVIFCNAISSSIYKFVFHLEIENSNKVGIQILLQFTLFRGEKNHSDFQTTYD